MRRGGVRARGAAWGAGCEGAHRAKRGGAMRTSRPTAMPHGGVGARRGCAAWVRGDHRAGCAALPRTVSRAGSPRWQAATCKTPSVCYLPSRAPRRWRGGAMGTSRPTAKPHEGYARQRGTRGTARARDAKPRTAVAHPPRAKARWREPGGWGTPTGGCGQASRLIAKPNERCARHWDATMVCGDAAPVLKGRYCLIRGELSVRKGAFP